VLEGTVASSSMYETSDLLKSAAMTASVCSNRAATQVNILKYQENRY
jgi:hypothetical protein